MLFEEAKRYLVGGVNSPVRSFRSVGGNPVFVKQARGSKIFAEDGNILIDYCMSWGALPLGHAHPEVVGALRRAIRKGTSYGMPTRAETELSKLIVEAFPSLKQVRLTSSGTEAVMGAIRVARAFTGKDKIIKFEGCYHGHADYLLVRAGSGASTLGIPDSAGVPADFSKNTLVAPFNHLEKTAQIMKRHGGEIAAIIVEPVAGNMGVVPPAEGFLKGLRALCDRYGALLIFDEVMTGFRLIYGGAQKLYGITPDLTCLGKIVGGGMPLGVFGGRREVMKVLAPVGPAYQAGTLSGNPVAVAAGIAALKCLGRTKPYEPLEGATQILCDGIRKEAGASGVSVQVQSVGSMFTVFFTSRKVIDYQTATQQDLPAFRTFFHVMLKHGVYLAPSAFEANFVSVKHTSKDIQDTLRAVHLAFKKIHEDA